MLSPRGRCRPFDDSADGIVLGEGVAAVVLKRLADAERDGDKIYSVIKGIGSSSDGHNRSLTAPDPRGQVLAIERAYADAGVDMSSVSLIEAHGTGTPSSTASRTVVVGDFRWPDRLAAWALIQGFDEREREALSDCRD